MDDDDPLHHNFDYNSVRMEEQRVSLGWTEPQAAISEEDLRSPVSVGWWVIWEVVEKNPGNQTEEANQIFVDKMQLYRIL